MEWIETAKYPFVSKLATGAGSENVALVHNKALAKKHISRKFRHFVLDLDVKRSLGVSKRILSLIWNVIYGSRETLRYKEFEPQAGYFLCQEFLAGNEFDTRVVVIGKRAFAFRRFTRKGDFRASGSGVFDANPENVDERFIRLAYKAARKLGMQSCALDGMYRGEEPVIGEVSYTYVSGVVYDCPGHWELDGDPETGALTWVPGNMWPEEAQVEDFLERLETAART